MNALQRAEKRIYRQDYCSQKNLDALLLYPKIGLQLDAALNDIRDILSIARSKDLDLVGRHVGVEREHERLVVNARAIGFPTAVCGHRRAYCKAPSWAAAKVESDRIYRMLLRAKIIQNTKDCTIEDIETTLAKIVSSSRIIVEDFQDMSFRVIFVGTLTEEEKRVIDKFQIIPKPSGVKLLGYLQTGLTLLLGKSFAVCGNKKAILGYRP